MKCSQIVVNDGRELAIHENLRNCLLFFGGLGLVSGMVLTIVYTDEIKKLPGNITSTNTTFLSPIRLIPPMAVTYTIGVLGIGSYIFHRLRYQLSSETC